ncbi:muconolactone Delta-isomerase family protein [Acrocarpospora catenulata]|uniref:muconolactone Delta-isomerase family protein n=1 Tax=Acrocarpospora catenulata TaxID=2836182 RepID=UPI001BDA7049|nr:muconolactone Delta-isomerase family protein [Acrocarpospora catenulata]
MRIQIDTGDLQAAAVDALRAEEAVRARALAESGVLRRLWRIPGQWANWGLWMAYDEAELQAVLDSLPLRPYMHIDINALDSHPNDPETPGQKAKNMRGSVA